MIPLNDLKRHQAAHDATVRQAVARVLDSGWFVLGPECNAFEAEFAAYCGVGHCIGVANGTDAIELALRALGVAADSRVATVANAGFYTSTALGAIGAQPVYVDVDESTHLMDTARLEAALGAERLDAVVVTHLYGRLHDDIGHIVQLAARRGVPVLEDCAQAHGARRDGRSAGSFGDAAAFSFYPTKNLGALGDGGAVATQRADVAASVRRLRQYGWESKYRVAVAGGRNSRLDEMQAAILRAKLTLLDGWNARRRQIAARYGKALRAAGIACPAPSGEEYVAHLYVIRADARDALRERLAAAGVGTDVHYPISDTRQPCWGAETQWPALPVTERLAAQVLSLPCYPELTDEEVDTVIAAVLAAVSGRA